MRSPPATGIFAVLASIPWCCVLPAVLSLCSLGGMVATRIFLLRLGWLLLPLSGAMLARALWLVHIQRRGQPWARWVTWSSAALAATLWLPRLWSWITR